MNNPTSRRIRHNFTTYNTGITQLIPTIVNLQSVREAHQAFPTLNDCLHDNHGRQTQSQQCYKSASSINRRE